jgi:hypothetical protein
LPFVTVHLLGWAEATYYRKTGWKSVIDLSDEIRCVLRLEPP